GAGCCGWGQGGGAASWQLIKEAVLTDLPPPPIRLAPDLYSVYAAVWDRDFKNLYSAQSGPTFHVRDESLNPNFGVFHEPAEWRWRYNGDGKQVASAPEIA